MRETWVRSLGWEDPLEKEMATHSSTLAWKIPWMEEPGRLQSMGLQRVGHDWSTSLECFHNFVDLLKTTELCTLLLFKKYLFGCVGSELQYVASSLFVAVCELLVVACGSSSLNKTEPRPPVLGMWSLSHWTTREVPELYTLKGWVE